MEGEILGKKEIAKCTRVSDITVWGGLHGLNHLALAENLRSWKKDFFLVGVSKTRPSMSNPKSCADL